MPPVLLVHGLPGDPEFRGDLLPRPALVARTAHLHRLQLLQQPAQRGDGPQAHPGIAVTGPLGEIRCFGHTCQPTLTCGPCQPWLTSPACERRARESRTRPSEAEAEAQPPVSTILPNWSPEASRSKPSRARSSGSTSSMTGRT